MSIKKKLAMGIATGALAVSMIGGGTYAYFSDTETSTNTFKAGTLDLALNPTEIINVDNIKPGDWMNRSFTLKNDGSLDIAKVLLDTDYVVTDANGDNVEDFGQHIRVNFMWNPDKNASGIWLDNVIYNTTLAELKGMTPDAVANKIFIPYFEERGGLKAGDSDTLGVQFEFVENNADQNEFQGDSLQLTWKFEAKQGKGVAK
ncbi:MULTISPECIES: CalY family protein [Solibacillus]|uniref:M73 family metallopeptidase n=1 Tax=Solibacillus merdavium TaxID=2762218 RepID=A0ABR8XPE7_9BACL|nr:CalY family protein [Solibacillus merdavium]MBD8033824.1 M73 family metallopeptidase [Solibacillus merdavium]